MTQNTESDFSDKNAKRFLLNTSMSNRIMRENEVIYWNWNLLRCDFHRSVNKAKTTKQHTR